VKAFIAARPGIQKTLGPHGITLMSHAKAGGPDAAAVVQYLAALGDADTPTPTQPLAPPIAMRSSASTSTVPDRAITSRSTCRHASTRRSRHRSPERSGAPRPGTPRQPGLFPTGVPTAKIAFAKRRQGHTADLGGSECDVTAAAKAPQVMQR
jgi:hypothetical protein